MTTPAVEAICEFLPPFLRFLRQLLAELDLSPARFQVLEALGQGEALRMVELADRLSVTKRNITALVDGLEKDGLVERRPHPADRRSTLISLTSEGRSVFAKAARAHSRHLEALLGDLGPQQRDAMTRALNQLTERLRNESDAG
ncbi:MAG: MarR family transcriptional regulator [Myxococcota bacterium]